MNQSAHHSMQIPRVIAWEVTRRCPLQCRHCRGAARDMQYSGELTTADCLRVISSIASFCKPVLILTGGEPMTRPDIYEIAAEANKAGMRVVMAPCGTLITPETAAKIRETGIQALSISLDGADAEAHDRFRGVPGAFAAVMNAIEYIKAEHIPFQINTTVTRANVNDLPLILGMAERCGAKTLDLFFLVPTGRGTALKDLEISAEEYERTLEWVASVSSVAGIAVKTTCAPHYARIAASRASDAKGRPAGGCIAGRGFVFISHIGILQPCGFLDIPCGDLRASDFNFKHLYDESPVFNALRRTDEYHGKCGICEFQQVCGGCRARAYADSGDFLGQEPRCQYTPGHAEMEDG